MRAAFLPGVAEGYRFMLIPRWEALKNPTVWITAMGQAFFSLSVTGSGMIVYGAYLDKKEDVIGVSRHTALFDTVAAVVAALVIIPACFSYGVDVDAGPGLLFVTLPNDSAEHSPGPPVCRHPVPRHDFCRGQLAAKHV